MNESRAASYTSSLYRPLTENDIKRIAEAAFRVLSESGVAVYSPIALEALRRAGADADEQTRIVKLPKSLVEDAIDSNPSSITLYSRDGRYDAVLENNRVHYGTGGTAIKVIDPVTGETRPSETRDVILNARLVDNLENIHVFTINVFPNDVVRKDEIDTNRFFHSFDNTTKHVMGGIYSTRGLDKVIEMAASIAGGKNALREKPFVSFITLIISPFKIDGDYGDMTCRIAGEGLPAVVPTEPICGTTSPVTLAGNVLTHIAETLAGITLVQSVRKGAPGICGSVGSISNLQTMGHLGGPIERGMINSAVAQMAQYFSLPLYSTAGTTDAKSLDPQAAYESAMSNLLTAMSGANYIHDAAGLMESDLTVSYEKLVTDNEILGMCQRVLKGIEVSDETLATDLMIEKGPGEHFLLEEHTINHMKSEFFSPDIALRGGDEEDAGRDGGAFRSRAARLVRELAARRAGSRLPEDKRAEVIQSYPEILHPELPSFASGNEL